MANSEGCIVRNVTTGHSNVSASDPNPVFVLVTLITHLKWNSVCVISNVRTGYEAMTLVDELSKRNIFIVFYHVSEVTSSNVDALANSKLKNQPDRVKFVLFCNKQDIDWCRTFLEKPFDYDRKHVWRNSLLHFSRWIVLVTGNNNILDLQEKIQFDNVAVVQTRGHEQNNLFTHNRTQCSTIYTLLWDNNRTRVLSPVGGVYRNGTLRIDTDIFPNTKHGFNGRKFKISTLPWPPFTIKSNGTHPYAGFLMDMLIEIPKSLNFTYDIQDAVDGKWGAVEDEKTNTWNGLIGELQRREVDLVVAPVTINPHREEVMDFTHPFYYEFSAILFKKQNDGNSRWTTLLNIFRPEVLLFTGAALIVVSLVLFALEKYSPFYKKQNRTDGLHHFSDSFWYMYGALLTQGGNHMAQAMSGRTFLTSWWLFCIILAAAYSGNFVAVLTVSKEILPFSNIEELVKQKHYEIGTIGASIHETILKTSDLPERIALWNKIVELNKTDPSVLSDNLDVQVQKVLESDFYAFLGDKSGTDLALLTHCELATAESDLMPLPYGLALPNHSPFDQLFSDEVVTILESGLMSMWRRQYLPTTTTKCLPYDGANKVTLFEIQLAFYLVSIGILFAFILLFCENIHRRIKRWWYSRHRRRYQHNTEKSEVCENETLNRFAFGEAICHQIKERNHHQVSEANYNPGYEANSHQKEKVKRVRFHETENNDILSARQEQPNLENLDGNQIQRVSRNILDMI